MPVKFYCDTRYVRYYASNDGYTRTTELKCGEFDNLYELVDFVMDEFRSYFLSSNSRRYNPCYGGMYDYDEISKLFYDRISMGKNFHQNAEYDEETKEYKLTNNVDDWKNELIKALDKDCKGKSSIEIFENNEKYPIEDYFMTSYHYDQESKQHLGAITTDRLGTDFCKPSCGEDLFHFTVGIINKEDE